MFLVFLWLRNNGYPSFTNSPFGHPESCRRVRDGGNRYDTVQTCGDTRASVRNFYNDCIREFGTAGFSSVWLSMIYLPPWILLFGVPRMFTRGKVDPEVAASYCRKGIPNRLNNSRPSSSVGAVVTTVTFNPRISLT